MDKNKWIVVYGTIAAVAISIGLGSWLAASGDRFTGSSFVYEVVWGFFVFFWRDMSGIQAIQERWNVFCIVWIWAGLQSIVLLWLPRSWWGRAMVIVLRLLFVLPLVVVVVILLCVCAVWSGLRI